MSLSERSRSRIRGEALLPGGGFDSQFAELDPYVLERQFIARVRQRVEEADREQERIVQATRYNPFDHYEGDYLAFCEKELGERYTEDQKRLFLSLVDNPVILAKTGNAVGKSRVAAAFGLSYFFCHLDAQVFTFMAPPED